MKTLLITGASRGIGLEIVKSLEQEYHIINISRSLGALNGSNIEHIELDLSQNSNLPKLENILKNKKIDILINNAGGGAHSKIQNISIEKMQEAVNLNLNTAIILSKIVSKNMIKNKSGQIINIASIHALSGNANSSLYSAAKFGLRGFSESLYYELKKHSIKVTTIYPDLVDTELLPKSFKGRDKILKPKNISDIVNYILNLPDKVVIKDLTVSYV